MRWTPSTSSLGRRYVHFIHIPSMCYAMSLPLTAIIVIHTRLTHHLHRLTTSSSSHTSQASSGTRKNATPASSYTRRPQAHPLHPSPRRRRAARNRQLRLPNHLLRPSAKHARRETLFLALFLKAAFLMEANDDVWALLVAGDCTDTRI
jgi:hypothetical protein